MKKISAIVLCLLLIAGILAGCANHTDIVNDDKLNIVATIFPEYDWVRQIVGENNERVDVTLLLDNGVDMHSFQPAADDIVKISTCDVFIYVGGESDKWVEDALAEAVNQDMTVINLLEVLGDAAKIEEAVEGMETEGDEGDAEYDEHVWVSLKNAAALCRYISDTLCRVDPDGKDVYAANADAYIEKLNALDAAYEAAVEAAPHRTVLFGDRFPFRYLADDYGLAYYAAFPGCSAETEASFETVIFLANKVDELGLKAILQIESADGSIARTIRENTTEKDQQILTLDSLQSTTSRDINGGLTYLSAMESNLAVLKDALK